MYTKTDSNGFPDLPGVNTILPLIALSRISGKTPCYVHAVALGTTATGSSFPKDELRYEWSCDDENAELVTDTYTGESINLNADQDGGPQAVFMHRTAGTYTYTLTVSGWTGSSYATATATATVTVTAWSGTTHYVSEANGDDTNDGLAGTVGGGHGPWKTLSKVFSSGVLLGTTNNKVSLDRGGSYTCNRTDYTLFVHGTGLRVDAYGSGADPVVYSSVSTADVLEYYGTDVVLSNIHFQPRGIAAQIAECVSGPCDHVGLDHCTTSTSATSDYTIQPPAPSKGVYVYGGTITSVVESHQGIYMDCGGGTFYSIVGTSISGGGRAIGGALDHHIYLNHPNKFYGLCLDFGHSDNRNNCINGNCISTPPVEGVYSYNKDVLLDRCNFRGTNNATDWNNSTNDPIGGGRFTDVLMNRCAYHVGDNSLGQAIGITCEGCERIVVRNARAWGNKNDVSPGLITDLQLHRMYTHHTVGYVCNLSAGAGALKVTALDCIHQHAADASNTGNRIFPVRTSMPNLNFRRNKYFAPAMLVSATVKPFRNADTATDLTFAGFQALGPDSDGSYADPGFIDPANGNFNTEAPATATGFTIHGPSSGPTGAPSTFTVETDPPGTFVADTVSLDLADDVSGTIDPATVSFSGTDISKTFTDTPDTDGARNITAANDGGLDDPDAFPFEAIGDTTPPVLSALHAPSVNATGLTSYTFSVTLVDDTAVDVSTLATGNFTVTGPNAYSQVATFLSVDTNTDGTPRTAYYSITPPHTAWDIPDNGPYTIHLNSDQIADTNGNAMDAADIGTFAVAVRKKSRTNTRSRL
jgi:hypothetical protein